MSAANTTSQPPTTKSSTLASLKSSFIAKVNHAAVRRQRSAIDRCDSDVTSGPTDVTVTGRHSGGRGGGGLAAVAQGGVYRRRIRSPFSSSRLLSEPNKSSRSSLAEQRIIESVVFRPSASSSSGRSVVHRVSDAGDAADVTAALSDEVVERQDGDVVKRSVLQGQSQGEVGLMTCSSSLVRSVSTNNGKQPLLQLDSGNTSELP